MAQTTNRQITCTPVSLRLNDKRSVVSRRSRERVISEAVDDSLSSFGEPIRQLVYSQLETSFEIKKQEIPFRINEFAEAVEEMFGEGAKLIEAKIIQKLHEKAQGFIHFPKGEDLLFTEYLDSLPAYL
ncbi:TPA: hypothetical protein HA274_06810 [Candidatus Bathyarchaeota archaeon]|nr:hypothetical protein [Candidatus Bathyarchaeota archaeon]